MGLLVDGLEGLAGWLEIIWGESEVGLFEDGFEDLESDSTMEVEEDEDEDWYSEAEAESITPERRNL